MMYGYYPHMFGYGFGFGSVLMPIFMLVVWILIIWAVIAFIRGGKCWDGRCDFRDKSEDSALKILKDRYAKGEITKEDFDRMRKDLKE